MAGATAEDDRPVARRPLWLAGLAALLVASLLAWIVMLSWFSWDNARLAEGRAFEGDGMVAPPAAFTARWWQDAALAFPRIALVLLFYAVPLIAIIAVVERSGRNWSAALAGAGATLPLACAWVFLALNTSHPVRLSEVLVPLLLLALAGTAGGAAAKAVRYGVRV